MARKKSGNEDWVLVDTTDEEEDICTNKGTIIDSKYLPDLMDNFIMEKPIPLVIVTEDGQLDVDPKAVEVLRSFEKPIVSVSIVGSYRKGKSFLLNLLMNKTDGFPLGSSIKAQTKGVWMWLSSFPGDSSKGLLLLDTEGLHDAHSDNRSHDVWVFTLSILLSSVLVYNSSGNIDANAIDGLYLASELTDHIKTKTETEEETGDELVRFFPMLIWAVRDHFLNLKEGDKEITADEYLESCLKRKKGFGKSVDSYNAPRDTIRGLFRNRHCFVFPPPTDHDNLTQLDKMRIDDLDPRFIEVGRAFSNFILTQSPCKLVEGKEVNGPMFATLATIYTAAIMKGNICIQSTFDSLIQTENAQAIQNALKAFKKHMGSLTLPVTDDVLNKRNQEGQEEAVDIFLKTSINSSKSEEYFEKLQTDLNEELNKFVQDNNEASSQRCNSILNELFSDIEIQLRNGYFVRPKGSFEFKNAVTDLKKRFEAISDHEKGPQSMQSWVSFYEEKITPILENLILTDQALSDEEKKQEKLKLEKEELENYSNLMASEIETLQEKHAQAKEMFKRNLEQQQEEFARQQKIIGDKIKEDMDKAMEERTQLLQQGFEDQAELMRQELEEAKETLKKNEEVNKKREEEMMKQFLEMQQRNDEKFNEMIKNMKDAQAKVETEAKHGAIASVMSKFVDVAGNIVSQVLKQKARLKEKRIETSAASGTSL